MRAIISESADYWNWSNIGILTLLIGNCHYNCLFKLRTVLVISLSLSLFICVISYLIELVCKHFNVTITIIVPVFGNMSVLPCSYQNSKLCNIKCGCVPGHQKHLYKKYAAIIPNLLTAFNLLVSICVSVCVCEEIFRLLYSSSAN